MSSHTIDLPLILGIKDQIKALTKPPHTQNGFSRRLQKRYPLVGQIHDGYSQKPQSRGLTWEAQFM